MAAAWDPAGGRLIIAGGNGPRRDTWGLSAAGWTQLADLPHGRFNPAMAFDRRTDRLILFGGWTGKERIAATLTSDGSEWRPFSGPEPPARNHALLVPTGDGSRLLLSGGHDGERVFSDLWRWDGQWRLIHDGGLKQRIDNGN